MKTLLDIPKIHIPDNNGREKKHQLQALEVLHLNPIQIRLVERNLL